MLPSAVAKAYNFPEGRSLEKQTVAIIQLGGSFNPQDILDYCDKHGYIKPELYIETVDNAVLEYTGPNGADGEVCLDTCVVAAVAQGVRIVNIFAPNSESGFAHAIESALDHDLKPCVISISWGAPITRWTVKGRSMMDSAMKRAAAIGIPIFVASGDLGSRNGTDKAVVDYPSSSPWAIGCGGTHLITNPDGTRKFEKAWTLGDGRGSTGGGHTDLYEKPDYQKICENGTCPMLGGVKGRAVPDVSGNADPGTGYDIIADGVSMTVGGTSAVSPLYAALWAIICSRLDVDCLWDLNAHEILYGHAVTVDVVGGENGDYQCTTNYDLCTGLGVLNGEALLETVSYLAGLPVLPPEPAKPQQIIPDNPQKVGGWRKWFNRLRQIIFGFRMQPLHAVSHLHIQEECSCR